MGNFNQGGSRFGANRGGGSRFGGNDRRPGGDRRAGPAMMHKAKCSDCGNECEVPFRPTGDKPVYCNDCFGSKRDRGSDRAPMRPSFGGDSRANDEIKKSLSELNIKLDKLIFAFETKPISETPAKKVAKKVVKKVAKKK